MAELTAPLFAGDAFLRRCLNGQGVMGDRPDDEAPVGAVRRVQQAMLLLGIDVGPRGADGDWGVDTRTAVLEFKTALNIRTDDGFLDGYVGKKTMTALEAIFGYAKFDERAVAVLDLGQRTGDQVDQGGGVVTVAYESGIVACIDWTSWYPVPVPLSDAWLDAGAAVSEAGPPVADPFILLGSVSAQAFANAGLVGTIAGEAASVRLDVLDELATGVAGAPAGQPIALAAAGDVTGLPGEQGFVFWADGAPALALPQEIVDRWSDEALDGNPLGAPAGFAFADATGVAYPFALGTLVALAKAAGIVRTDAAPATLDRFRLPQDPARHLEAAIDHSDVRQLVGGPAFFAALANDLARVGPGGHVYIASWNCEVDLACFPGGGTLRQELTRLGGLGAEIRMQLWAARPLTGAVGSFGAVPAAGIAATMLQGWFVKPNRNNKPAINAVTSIPNGFGFLDDRHATFGSHHQKVVVLNTGTDLVAYVGGIEFTDDRVKPVSSGAPLFDVSVRIAGPGAKAVLRTFDERWHAHPTGGAHPLTRTALPVGPALGPVRVQVGHTYAAGFPFAGAIRTASELTANAILSARTYFYMEDQYFVGDPRLDAAIRAALGRGVTGIAVIAAEDSVSDLPDVGFRRRKFVGPLLAAHPGRFLVFEAVGDNGTSTGEHAYVHSKLTIVDDEAVVIGSMNSSRRSWSHDSEVMAALVDANGPGGGTSGPGFAKALRIDLWTRHLKGIGLPAIPIDPLPGALAAWSGAAAGVPGLSVRPYPPAGSVAHRPPFKPALLDLYWDTFADPP